MRSGPPKPIDNQSTRAPNASLADPIPAFRALPPKANPQLATTISFVQDA